MATTTQSVIGLWEEMATNEHEQGKNDLDVLKKMTEEQHESLDTA